MAGFTFRYVLACQADNTYRAGKIIQKFTSLAEFPEWVSKLNPWLFYQGTFTLKNHVLKYRG